MNNDEILEQVKTADNLRAYVEQITERRGPKTYVCPICGSGNGPKKTAAFNLNGDKWKCFSCGNGGDLLDLIGEVEHIDGYTERLHRAAEIFGIDHDRQPRPATYDEPLVLGQTIRDVAPKPDYTEGREWHRAYVAEAVARLRDHAGDYPEAIEYLRGRNLLGMGLGYDPQKRRIVIPWPSCDYYHADRDITGNAKHKYLKPKSDSDEKKDHPVGPIPFWDRAALRSPAFFVVEGELDALAVKAAGGDAVALCGTSNVMRFVNEYTITTGAGLPVILLDMDAEGRRASTDLVTELEKRGVTYLEVSPDMWGGSAKDAGEAWQKSPEGLKAFVAKAKDDAAKRAEEKPKPPKWVDMREYLKEGGEWDAERQRRKNLGTVSTGLKHLDGYVGGGLTPDLYLIGGGPGMGKTSIALQIADHIAAEGWPVLYVCTEQTPFELACKSIARTAYLNGMSGDDDKGHKMTALSLIQGYYPVRARAAAEEYTSHPTPVVIGADFDESIETVREKIDAYEKAIRDQGETKPLTVVIDYLQLLRSDAAGANASEREITDRKVAALKAMQKNDGGQARIMIVLSSLNRDSYREISTKPPTLASFKESGSIEYTAAVAIMLWRFAGTKERDPDVDRPDGAVIRARIVKNRYGRADRTVWILHNKERDLVESMAYQDMVNRGYIDAVDDTEAEDE